MVVHNWTGGFPGGSVTFSNGDSFIISTQTGFDIFTTTGWFYSSGVYDLFIGSDDNVNYNGKVANTNNGTDQIMFIQGSGPGTAYGPYDLSSGPLDPSPPSVGFKRFIVPINTTITGIYSNTGTPTWTFIRSDSQPCFSRETLLKIIKTIPANKSILISKTKRNKKVMYRCEYGNLGTLEFTADHAFLYKDHIYKFEDLIKINPILKKNARLMSENESPYVYNIYGHYKRLHKDNKFEMGPNLYILGGYIQQTEEEWLKVKKTMTELEKEIKTNSDIKKKYCIERFFENDKIDSLDTYIVIV